MKMLWEMVSKALLSCFPGAFGRPNRSLHMQDHFGGYSRGRGRFRWLKFAVLRVFKPSFWIKHLEWRILQLVSESGNSNFTELVAVLLLSGAIPHRKQ